MNTYSYIDKNGVMKTVQAADDKTALATAPDIKADSGVRLNSSGSGDWKDPNWKNPLDNGFKQTENKTAVYGADGNLSGYKNPDGSFTAAASTTIAPSNTDRPIFDYNAYKNDLASEKAKLDSDKEIQRKAIIDAITNKYNSRAAGIDQVGAGELARTRSLNLKSGLIASPVGDTAIGGTEKKTQAAKDANDAAKTDEILSAMNKLDETYYTRKRDLTGDKLNELKTAGDIRTASIAERETYRKPVATIITSLAKKGVTYDQFKLDSSYANVKNDFTDQELQAMFISGADSSSFLSDKPEIVGSNAVWFQKQSDGTIKQIKVDLGVNPDAIKDVMKTDAGIYIIKKDGTHELISGSGSVENMTNKDKLTEAYKTVAPQLQAVAGSDGFVSPQDYKKARSAWLAAGHAAKDFDDQFSSFVNTSHSADYGFSA